jgi:hypothetical protein
VPLTELSARSRDWPLSQRYAPAQLHEEPVEAIEDAGEAKIDAVRHFGQELAS